MVKKLTAKKYKTLKKLIIIYLAFSVAISLIPEILQLERSYIPISLILIALYLIASGVVSFRYGIYLHVRRSFNFYLEPGLRTKAIGIAEIVLGLLMIYVAYLFIMPVG